mgnify:CR=1 FL=1
MKLAFIVNSRIKNSAIVCNEIASEFSNFTISFYKTNYPKHAKELASDYAQNSDILIAVGGDGVAAKLSYSDDSLGEIDFNFSRGKSTISNKQADVILGDLSTGEFGHDLDLQASVYWRPTNSQWRFGFSALDSTFNYDSGNADNYSDGSFTFQF